MFLHSSVYNIRRVSILKLKLFPTGGNWRNEQVNRVRGRACPEGNGTASQ
jgi:hypothetical protein